MRPVDGMSESLANSTFCSSYKFGLPGIDGVSVLARTMLDSVTDEGLVCLGLSDGTALEGCA